jgi:hypothetical protein
MKPQSSDNNKPRREVITKMSIRKNWFRGEEIGRARRQSTADTSPPRQSASGAQSRSGRRSPASRWPPTDMGSASESLSLRPAESSRAGENERQGHRDGSAIHPTSFPKDPDYTSQITHRNGPLSENIEAKGEPMKIVVGKGEVLSCHQRFTDVDEGNILHRNATSAQAPDSGSTSFAPCCSA